VVTQASFSNSASGTFDLADACGRKKRKKREKEKNQRKNLGSLQHSVRLKGQKQMFLSIFSSFLFFCFIF